jgi:hypothetical protein
MDVGFGFIVAPGQCFCCGSSDQNMPRADLGEVPSIRRTRMYLCEQCVMGAAKKIGELGGNFVVLQAREAAQLDARADTADEWRERAEAAEGKLADLASLVRES